MSEALDEQPPAWTTNASQQVIMVSLLLNMLPFEQPLASPMWPEATVTGTVFNRDFDELSGLTTAFGRDDRFWTHNDSGDTARIFLIDAELNLLTTYPIEGVEALDVEDIARGPCAADDPSPCLYIADIGDNRRARRHVHIWLVREPSAEAPAGPLVAEQIWHVQYPDRPRDAESLIVDPRDATPYLITKARDGDSSLWRIPRGGTREAPATMERGASLGRWLSAQPSLSARLATAADLSHDARCLAVRTYADVWTWCAPAGGHFLEALEQEPDRARPPMLLQSEALAWDSQGRLWITGEGMGAPMLRLDPARGGKRNTEVPK